MSSLSFRHAQISPPTCHPSGPAAQHACSSVSRRVEDHQFITMQRGFCATGGLANGDAVARLMRRHSASPFSPLAEWIVARKVVNFAWQSQTMLPLFQFDLFNMKLRPGVIEVVRELSGVFDDWDVALWFAVPNGWLADSTPADVIVLNASAVVDAARADRFVACG